MFHLEINWWKRLYSYRRQETRWGRNEVAETLSMYIIVRINIVPYREHCVISCNIANGQNV